MRAASQDFQRCDQQRSRAAIDVLAENPRPPNAGLADREVFKIAADLVSRACLAEVVWINPPPSENESRPATLVMAT